MRPVRRQLNTSTACLAARIKGATYERPDGADLMFTPGRCKKTRSSRFGVTALEAILGGASAVSGAGTRGEGVAPDAPRDGSGKAGCAGSTDGEDDGSGRLRAAWAGVSDDDCTAIGEVSAVSVGAFGPGEAIKKYVSPAMPNAATIAVPAIREALINRPKVAHWRY